MLCVSIDPARCVFAAAVFAEGRAELFTVPDLHDACLDERLQQLKTAVAATDLVGCQNLPATVLDMLRAARDDAPGRFIFYFYFIFCTYQIPAQLHADMPLGLTLLPAGDYKPAACEERVLALAATRLAGLGATSRAGPDARLTPAEARARLGGALDLSNRHQVCALGALLKFLERGGATALLDADEPYEGLPAVLALRLLSL